MKPEAVDADRRDVRDAEMEVVAPVLLVVAGELEQEGAVAGERGNQVLLRDAQPERPLPGNPGVVEDVLEPEQPLELSLEFLVPGQGFRLFFGAGLLCFLDRLLQIGEPRRQERQ